MTYCKIKDIKRSYNAKNRYLSLSRIKINGKQKLKDCSYLEELEFSFQACNKDGSVDVGDLNEMVIATLIVETGSSSFPDVANALKSELMSNVDNILNIDILIQAFKYRNYYSNK